MSLLTAVLVHDGVFAFIEKTASHAVYFRLFYNLWDPFVYHSLELRAI